MSPEANMCHQDALWLMFKLHQIKGYFSFSIEVSPKDRISVIFNKFEFLELSLCPRVTRAGDSECFMFTPVMEDLLSELPSRLAEPSLLPPF